MESDMYQLVPVPITPTAKLSEEELLRAADIKPACLRLGIAFGLIAVLVLSLDLSCKHHRPQTGAADGLQTLSCAP
jgi:hypothetical protein